MKFIYTNKKLLLSATQALLIGGSIWLLHSRFADGLLSVGLKDSIALLDWWHFGVLLVFSGCFWMLDTSAWRMILKPFAHVPFLAALRYNLVAQSAGIITPFLVGDYGARSLLLKAHINARQNTLVTLAYQLVKVTTRIVVGLVAIVVLSLSATWQWLPTLLGAGMLIAGAFFINKTVKALGQSSLGEKIFKGKGNVDFALLNTKKALLPALLLFLTYCLQTTFLLRWMDDHSAFLSILSGVVLTYSATSFLPPLSIFDPVAKSAFAALLGASFAQPEHIIVAFSVTWIINRGVPALLAGLLFRRFTRQHHTTSSTT